jgi:hypothetical protein
MEIETESEQTYEAILNIGDENMIEASEDDWTKALFIHRVRIIVFWRCFNMSGYG